MQSIRTRRRRSRGIRRETGRMNWITSSHTEYTELDLRGGWIIEAIPNRLPRGGRKRADGTSGDGDVSFFSGKNSQGTICELWRNTTESWTTHSQNRRENTGNRGTTRGVATRHSFASCVVRYRLVEGWWATEAPLEGFPW